MYPDLRFNNKKRIIWLIKLATMVLFVVVSFVFGYKAYTDATSYDFSLTGKAYEKSGAPPTSPTDYDFEAEAADYTNISSSNDARWETSLATAGEWDSQIYTFIITDDLGTITNLTLEWEGYGDTDTGFLTYFYIWNLTSSSWEQLDSRDFTSEADITLTGSIISNISDYIDPGTKELTIMTATQKTGVSLGEPCSVPEQCFSGFCVDGVCCNNTCTGDCEACNLSGTEGTCTTRSADDNTECATCQRCDGTNTTCQYVDLSEEGKNCTTVCYECNGSGSCVSIADYQADEKGLNQCNVDASHCVGDTFYGGYACVSETCTDNNDIGCCQGSKCSSGNYCDELTHTCTAIPVCQTRIEDGFGTNQVANNTQVVNCNGSCQACQSGGCAYATKGTDPGSDCNTGTTVALGCATGQCGGDAGCQAYTSGDRSCPTCYTCRDDRDVGCEKYVDGTQDAGGCNAVCRFCSNGSCVVSPNNNWGTGLYGCTGSNQRCYGGVCRTCGGWLYNDGCSGCAVQGGKGCWYEGPDCTDCISVCSGRGGCVTANWNDSTPTCPVCNHWQNTYACGAMPTAHDISKPWYNWQETHITRACYVRNSDDSQDCDAEPWCNSVYTARRYCVCNY